MATDPILAVVDQAAAVAKDKQAHREPLDREIAVVPVLILEAFMAVLVGVAQVLLAQVLTTQAAFQAAQAPHTVLLRQLTRAAVVPAEVQAVLVAAVTVAHRVQLTLAVVVVVVLSFSTDRDQVGQVL